VNIGELRQEIADFLGFKASAIPVPFNAGEVVDEQRYRRIRVSYSGEEGDDIAAYFLLPEGSGPFPAVLLHHQHNGERHLGKSEVCGLVGDPLQAFGPALARRGIAVLAPDSICFEDRRRNRSGTVPDESNDVQQHYNELSHRLVSGDTLMRKVLNDAARGLSVLQEHPQVDRQRVGSLGHSYGGSTVLFHSALDERIRFACSSGAASTYKNRLARGEGIEMAQVIPGFAHRFDIQDLVKCIAPRKVLLVSAREDEHSHDADLIVEFGREAFDALGAGEALEHVRYDGGHALTQDRFDHIVGWVVSCCHWE
jgi:dienelactone hydrolase